jgi:CRP/FNR family transcriptional regulator
VPAKARLADENVDFLSLMSAANRRQVLEKSTRVVYPAGTLLFREGDPARVILIERGLVRVFRTVSDGRQATVAFLCTREILGASMIVSDPPSACAQIVTNSTITDLDVKTLHHVATTQIQVMTAVATQLAALMRNAYRLVALRSLGNIRQRLAYDLLERACQSQLAMGRLEAMVTQTDLAASIGSSREVVSRAMKGLRASGIIKTAPGVVRVVDPARLADTVRAFLRPS